jgi:thioesterase domain-containing protein
MLAVANSTYVPRGYAGKTLLIRPQDRPAGTASDAAAGWGPVLHDIRVVDIASNHENMFLEPYVEVLAAAVSEALSVSDAIAWPAMAEPDGQEHVQRTPQPATRLNASE